MDFSEGWPSGVSNRCFTSTGISCTANPKIFATCSAVNRPGIFPLHGSKRESEFTSDTFFVGDGCQLVQDKLKGLNSLIYPHYPNALDLLTIAKKKFIQGETVGPEELLPIYISGEEHWQKA